MTPDAHNHRACRKMFAQLSEYLDRELDEDTAAKIRHHLADCPPCQTCLATLERTVGLFGALEPEPVPAQFTHRLMEFLHRTLGPGG